MDFTRLFDEAGCISSLHTGRLSDGTEGSHDADMPHVLASVVKVAIGLEFYAQVVAGASGPDAEGRAVRHHWAIGPPHRDCIPRRDRINPSLNCLSHSTTKASPYIVAGAVWQFGTRWPEQPGDALKSVA